MKYEQVHQDEKLKIMKSDTYKAASIAFSNACIKALDIHALVHYMFIEGIKYKETGEIPELIS